MSPDTIGYISGAIVALSGIPYLYRVLQGKIQTIVTPWALWALIGFVLLITFDGVGAGKAIWPAVFGFTNPLIISYFLWKQKNEWQKPDLLQKITIFIGVLAIIIWYFVQGNQSYTSYALYIAMIADLCASIPILIFSWKNPEKDRPFAWIAFGIGYSVTLFAIPQFTLEFVILPIFMFVTATSIALPMILFRVKNKISLSEWI